MQDFAFNVKKLETDCKLCASIVLNKVKAYEGVRDVHVDPATKQVRVEWDDPKACSGVACACGIEKLGYKVSMD